MNRKWIAVLLFALAAVLTRDAWCPRVVTVKISDGSSPQAIEWSKQLEAAQFPTLAELEQQVKQGAPAEALPLLMCWADDMSLPMNAKLPADFKIIEKFLAGPNGLTLPHICTFRARVNIPNSPVLEFYFYGSPQGRAEVSYNGKEYSVVAFEPLPLPVEGDSIPTIHLEPERPVKEM